MYFDDNGLRYGQNKVRWLCVCGEGHGVRGKDEHPEDLPQWVVQTPFNVLSQRMYFREHLRKFHGVTA